MSNMKNNIVIWLGRHFDTSDVFIHEICHQQVSLRRRANIPNYRKWIFWYLWSRNILQISMPFAVIALRVETASCSLRDLPHLQNMTALIMSRTFT